VPQPDVTRLLIELEGGRREAFESLVTLLYDDLRLLARRHLRCQGNMITLHTSGLVHEAYLKLADRTRLSWENRGHFLAVYTKVMRNILIDMARSKLALKRGGDRVKVTLDEHHNKVEAQADELLAIDQALEILETLDERLARIVECRFFAGLSEVETALALGISDRTVRRDWIKARTILHGLLEETRLDPEPGPRN
jgi:RNA polymerase sigma factor (TIGR02999 family)